MKRIFPSTQYKKDYKRFRNNPSKMKALAKIIDLLANEQPIPAQYNPHLLHGDYKGCMECHVQGEFLLGGGFLGGGGGGSEKRCI